MRLSYDLAKSERNELLRGLPFSRAESFDWTTALLVEDTRHDYPEPRYQALGLLDGRLHMLVFTPRSETLQVISLQKANRRERSRYVHKPNPELIDDDAPEADTDWFERAQPAAGVLPGLVGREAASQLLRPRRGRPPLEHPKEHLNIRLDADVVSAFRRTGSGWQTRLNDALRDWLKAHR